MKPEPSQDTNFYIVGWSCIIFILVYIILKVFFKMDLVYLMPGCTLYEATGYYCPGCGGTRAIFALVRGDIIKSLYFHPLVPYMTLVGGWFMISQTIERLSKGRIRIAMHFRMLYVWIGLALLAIQFIWKNGVLLFTGTALL